MNNKCSRRLKILDSNLHMDKAKMKNLLRNCKARESKSNIYLERKSKSWSVELKSFRIESMS